MKVRFSSSWPGLAALVAVAAVLPIRAQQSEPQQPVFRAGVELIEMDVSVLDRDRRPVRGLTANDFTVLEDGTPQRIVAVSAVDLAQHDPAQSARMRYVARDVAANDLSDQLGDGRLVAIVFDDVNLPADDPDIVRSARETARFIVDRLGPSDMAAVVYSQNGGRTQDFTSDRLKLLDAIDRFQPVRSDWTGPSAQTGGPGGGPLQQWSPTLARSSCMRGEPAVPTLDTVASRLATADGRRKAVMFISVGVSLSMSARDACGRELADVMKGVYRKAQSANVNIYGIDPAGFGGYQEYVRRLSAQRGADGALPVRRRAPRNIRVLQDFLSAAAANTGGRAVINTDAIEPAIDQILQEDRVYYIVGYEPSNTTSDGRFRNVEIRVNRPGASVRSRSGYWAPTKDEVVDRRLANAPSAIEATLSGLNRVQGVPLRVVLAPIAPVAGGARTNDVAVVLSVRYPPIRTQVSDTLTITRNVYDIDGRTGPPTRTVETVQLEPSGGEEGRYDFLYDVALEPGRRQIRYHVQSALLGVSGTVYADVDVPDFARSPLAMSGLVVAGAAPSSRARTGSVEHLLPIVPTSSREFSVNDVLTGFVMVHQAGEMPAPVAVTTEVFDALDRARFESTGTLEGTAFAAGAGVAHRFDIPLSQLNPGPHLLSVTARLPGGRTARRDIVFRVR